MKLIEMASIFFFEGRGRIRNVILIQDSRESRRTAMEPRSHTSNAQEHTCANDMTENGGQVPMGGQKPR